MANATSTIFNLMEHILWEVKLNQAKQYAMTQISLTCGLYIREWAQKKIPYKFWEGQHAYFAKEGMS